MAQIKEQTRSTEVQINEEEIGTLPEKEFRIKIVKMIKNSANKIEFFSLLLLCSALQKLFPPFHLPAH